jgi:azurin
MKRPLFFVFLISASLCLAPVVATSRAADEAAPKPIEISGDDTMKYNLKTFEVRRGQEVTIIFKNVGKLPKAAMGHNLVILKLNTNAQEFAFASAKHPESDYIDPELKNKVLASTKLLGPGESETLTFTAPEIPSKYDFLCTFPAHFITGMKGSMIVQ